MMKMSCDQPHEPVGDTVHEVDENIRVIRFEQIQQNPQPEKCRGNIRETVNDQGESVRSDASLPPSPAPSGMGAAFGARLYSGAGAGL